MLGTKTLAMKSSSKGNNIQEHIPAVEDAALVSAGGLNVHPNQAIHLAQAQKEKQFFKEQGGTISAPWANNTRIDIDVEPAGIGEVEQVWMEITMFNKGANTIAVAPAPYLLDYLEIRPNQGDNPLGKIYGENLFLSLLALHPDELEGMESILGVSREWLGKTPIGPGQSKTLKIPLMWGHWLGQAPVYFSSMFKKTVRFEAWMSNRTAVEIGNINDLDLTQFIIRFRYNEVDESRVPDFMSLPDRGEIKIFTNPQLFRTNVTLTAGTETRIPLDSIIGEMTGLQVMIRPVGWTASSPFAGAQRTFLPWDFVDLETAGGEKLLGGIKQDYITHETTLLPKNYPSGSQFAKQYKIIDLQHGSDPVSTIMHANNTGSFCYTGNENLVITPPAAANVLPVFNISPQSIFNGALAPPGTINSGFVAFGWTDPFTKRFSISTPITVTASNAVVVASIESMDSWDPRSHITISGANPLSGGVQTITFSSGPYSFAGSAIGSLGVSFIGVGGNGAANAYQYTVTQAVGGVRGWVNGQYEVTVWGTALENLHPMSNGTVMRSRHN